MQKNLVFLCYQFVLLLILQSPLIYLRCLSLHAAKDYWSLIGYTPDSLWKANKCMVQLVFHVWLGWVHIIWLLRYMIFHSCEKFWWEGLTSSKCSTSFFFYRSLWDAENVSVSFSKTFSIMYLYAFVRLCCFSSLGLPILSVT